MSRFGKIEQYLDDTGAPLANGKLYFYETGTSTPKDTYSDDAETSVNANPVVLDSNGRQPDIFFTGDAKVVLTKADDTVLATADPVTTQNLGAAEISALYLSNDDTNKFTDAEKTKLGTVTANANNYTHPNHSGDVVSVADGAQTLQPVAITGKTAITALDDADEFLVSNVNALKRVDFSVLFGSLTSFDYTTLANGEYYGLAVEMSSSGSVAFGRVAVRSSSGTQAITSYNQSIESLSHALGLTAASLGLGGGTFPVLLKGFIRSTTWSWTPGAPLYAETGTGLTETRPTTSTYYACRIGVAVTSDIVFVSPQDPIEI